MGGAEDETQYTVELQVVTAYGSNTKTVQVTLKRYRERSYYLTDHLGSIRTTVDMEGDVKGYDDYYPFGLPMTGHSVNSSNPNDDNKFTGYELDDEGNLNLYHANARGYDPILGRFNQIDPLSDSYPDWSSYAYGLNNPINMIDPTGMAPLVHLRWINRKEYLVVDKGDNLFDIIRFMDEHGISSLTFEDGDIIDERGYGIEGAKASTGRTLDNTSLNDIQPTYGNPPLPGGPIKNPRSVYQWVKNFFKSKPSAKTLNKANHLFGKAEHNLTRLLNSFGGDKVKALKAITDATKKAVNSSQLKNGDLYEVTVKVAGENVTVTGRIVNNIVEIGTAYIKF